MLLYAIKRAVYFALLLFSVSVIVFLAMRLVPGDPIVHLAGPFATEKQREQIRKSYGLDQPIFVQYAKWATRAVQGDLGRSMQLHIPVTELLLTKVGNTLILVMGSMVIAVVIGWAGRRRWPGRRRRRRGRPGSSGRQPPVPLRSPLPWPKLAPSPGNIPR